MHFLGESLEWKASKGKFSKISEVCGMSLILWGNEMIKFLLKQLLPMFKHLNSWANIHKSLFSAHSPKCISPWKLEIAVDFSDRFIRINSVLEADYQANKATFSFFFLQLGDFRKRAFEHENALWKVSNLESLYILQVLGSWFRGSYYDRNSLDAFATQWKA